MPAMYPEELRRLREQNPGLQYDFRGNVIGAAPQDSVQMAADAIYQLPGMQPDAWSFGPTRDDYLNSRDFVGPMPQQWWDPNGELAQQGLGALVSGQDLPDVGFYSQWDPDTNSWVRHGSPSDGGGLGIPRSGFRSSGRLGSPPAGASAGHQTGDPWNLRGWTPYEPNFGTGKRDLWRGSPEQTETFPNDAYGQS